MRTTVGWREEANDESERERGTSARGAATIVRTMPGRLATVKFKSVEI